MAPKACWAAGCGYRTARWLAGTEHAPVQARQRAGQLPGMDAPSRRRDQAPKPQFATIATHLP